MHVPSNTPSSSVHNISNKNDYSNEIEINKSTLEGQLLYVTQIY